MPRQFSSFNFIALIAILLFSLMLIAAQPKGKFISPVQPEINAVTIQSNENIYVYGAGKVAQLQSTGIKYFHNDYLGTLRVETNANKNIVASNNQYPFGEKLSQQGAEKYTFTGKELDDTGLQYFGARFYVSEIGRFIQVDPVGVGYEYSNNNPLRFVDPTGEQGVEVLPNDFVGPPAPWQVRAGDLPQSAVEMMGEPMFNSLSQGTNGQTFLYDVGGALAMANPAGYWLAWKQGAWNQVSEHEFLAATGQETFAGALLKHAPEIAIATVGAVATSPNPLKVGGRGNLYAEGLQAAREFAKIEGVEEVYIYGSVVKNPIRSFFEHLQRYKKLNVGREISRTLKGPSDVDVAVVIRNDAYYNTDVAERVVDIARETFPNVHAIPMSAGERNMGFWQRALKAAYVIRPATDLVSVK